MPRNQAGAGLVVVVCGAALAQSAETPLASEFTINFSGADLVNGMAGRGGEDGSPPQTSDPMRRNFALHRDFQRIGTESGRPAKTAIQVLVVDHIERKPTDT